MNKRIANKWVKALLSGKYKKTKGVLKDDKGYCCLGVLCELYAKEKGIKNYWLKLSDDYYKKQNSSSGTLPKSIKRWAKLFNYTGGFNTEIYRDDLARINDEGKKSFKYIANIIKRNYKIL